MTREEAITALGDRNNLLWGMSKEEQKYYSEALDMAISALQKNESAEEWYKLLCEKWDSAEGEYIKKEDATKAFSDYFMYLQRLKHDEGNGCKKYEQAGINWCLNTLDELPTYSFSFPEREKGEWVIREDNTSFVKQIPRRWVECSCCGWSFSYERIRDDYCSNCGADMRGE